MPTKIVNNTPFVIFTFLSQVAPPARSCTIVMKATFKLADDRNWKPADKQRKPQRDTPFMDDLGRSLAWASDFVAFKPNFDLLVQGSFHQPGGVPAPDGRAFIKLGPIEKELLFHGPRFVFADADGHWHITQTEPIAELPLRWEYSFGGLSDPRNPLGIGMDPMSDEQGPPRIPLPQIEYPDDQLRKLDDRPRPANFAPVPPRFAERLKKLGTRDQRWANFRAPLPPKDYDPSAHNAAPADQQATGFPRGNEVLFLRNLHPSIAELATPLPGLRARAGILRKVPHGMVAEEVWMRLDTIVALPDEDELVQVWRGVVALQGRSEEEILLVQVGTEQVEDEPEPFEAFSARMWEAYRATLPPEKKPKPPPDISGEMAQMRKMLGKVDLPSELREVVDNEPNPQKVLDALQKHVDDTLAALQKKYPPA
jgi:hypothetical protein